MSGRLQLFSSELVSSFLQFWLLLSSWFYILFYLSSGFLLHINLNLAYCLPEWNIFCLRIFIMLDMSSWKFLPITKSSGSFGLS